MLIFSPHEMKYIWYSPQKSKFSFLFYTQRKYRNHNLTFYLDLTFAVCLLGITLGVNTVCMNETQEISI